MKRLLQILICFMLLILTSCQKENNEEKEKTLNVAYQNSIAYAPILVAKEKGLIEKHLGDNVVVSYQMLANGAAINEAISAGSLDVGFLGVSVGVTGVTSGIPYKIFTGISCQPIGLMTNREEVKELKDITSDMQIAITNINSHPHILLAMAAKKYLGDAHALDANLVVLNNADGYTSLLSKAIDLHMVISPFNFLEENSQDLPIHEVKIEKEVWPVDNTFIVGVASNRLYEQDKDLYNAVCSALEEAMEFIKNEPYETAKILSANYDATPEEILNWMLDERSSYVTEVHGIMEMINFMVEEGFLDKEKAPASLSELTYDNVKGD